MASTSIPWVGAEQVWEVMPLGAAIDALERAWRSGLPEAPERMHVEVSHGDLLLMPSHSAESVGVKLVTVAPGNPASGLPLISGVYVLFDPSTLAPVLLVDAASLTAIRTAAVSGLATRLLADAGAHSLVVFGAGAQARSHVMAMRAVRPIETVRIIGRSEERVKALANELDAEVGRPPDIADADLICCCTTSESPLFEGSLIGEGTHLNAVGSYSPKKRELDATTMSRAAQVVVEDRALARAEAGDVVMAIEEGALAEQEVRELGEVIASGIERGPRDITVFKSVGMASEDLVVATALLEVLGLQ